MTKIDWRKVVVGSMMGVIMAGCANHTASPTTTAEERSTTDPDARRFQGTIVSLRPMTSTMLVSKDEHFGKDAFPNIITVKYDANTQFFLDGSPTTIDRIAQYMPVTIEGHMQDGKGLVAETARFSSNLPANVQPAAQAQAK